VCESQTKAKKKSFKEKKILSKSSNSHPSQLT
jgi:hypothetical protein